MNEHKGYSQKRGLLSPRMKNIGEASAIFLQSLRSHLCILGDFNKQLIIFFTFIFLTIIQVNDTPLSMYKK